MLRQKNFFRLTTMAAIKFEVAPWLEQMCEVLERLSNMTSSANPFSGFDSFSNIDSMWSCSKPPIFGDCQSHHQSEMAMNARHLTGAGTKNNYHDFMMRMIYTTHINGDDLGMVLGFSHYVIDGLRISVLQTTQKGWVVGMTNIFLGLFEMGWSHHREIWKIAYNCEKPLVFGENVPWIFRDKPNL